jgi:cytochrome c-type biogenesis protein CcmH
VRRWCALCLLAVAMFAGAADDAALDKRLDHVAQQLRCLVCQNQSIADSHAQLALDLKKEARAQLSQGRSEQEVIDFMVQRYGDFVLYRPPFNGATLLLWTGPFALLAAGLAALLVNLRRRGLGADDPVTEENA